MKRIVQFLVIPFFVLSLNSCSSDDDNEGGGTPASTTYRATLTGASEVPSNASTATGTATLSFNNTTKIFNLTVTYSGMTATAAHVHKGAVGVSGGPVFPITVTASPMYLTSAALTTEQEADLKANLYYVNIHSSAYPDGEIRGQLMKQTSGGGGGGGY
ncbi:MAG TPA: CHRD domain-containing protein [Flavobacterium sp.]|nr:CHRD domain-containing protein [Flavobacterium sp.]